MKLVSLGLAVMVAGASFFEATNMLNPTNKAETWRLDALEGAQAAMKIDEDAVVFEVSKPGSENWHVQAIQTGLDLKEGGKYVLEFKAKAASFATILVNAGIDEEDWHQIGLNEEVYLGKEYKTFKYTFTADGVVAKKNRISFVIGGEKCTVMLKDVTLTAVEAKKPA